MPKERKTLTERGKRRLKWWKLRENKTEAEGTCKKPIDKIEEEDCNENIEKPPAKKKAKTSKTSLKTTATSLTKKNKADSSEPLSDDINEDDSENETKVSPAKKKHEKGKKGTTTSSDTGGTLKKEDKGAKTRKFENLVLFVGNLPYTTTKEDILHHFKLTRGVKDVRLLTKKETGESRGCGYIDFVDQEAFKLGLTYHKSELNGRRINVEYTVPGKNREKRTKFLKTKNRNKKHKGWPQHKKKLKRAAVK